MDSTPMDSRFAAMLPILCICPSCGGTTVRGHRACALCEGSGTVFCAWSLDDPANPAARPHRSRKLDIKTFLERQDELDQATQGAAGPIYRVNPRDPFAAPCFNCRGEGRLDNRAATAWPACPLCFGTGTLVAQIGELVTYRTRTKADGTAKLDVDTADIVGATPEDELLRALLLLTVPLGGADRPTQEAQARALGRQMDVYRRQANLTVCRTCEGHGNRRDGGLECTCHGFGWTSPRADHAAAFAGRAIRPDGTIVTIVGPHGPGGPDDEFGWYCPTCYRAYTEDGLPEPFRWPQALCLCERPYDEYRRAWVRRYPDGRVATVETPAQISAREFARDATDRAVHPGTPLGRFRCADCLGEGVVLSDPSPTDQAMRLPVRCQTCTGTGTVTAPPSVDKVQAMLTRISEPLDADARFEQAIGAVAAALDAQADAVWIGEAEAPYVVSVICQGGLEQEAGFADYGDAVDQYGEWVDQYPDCDVLLNETGDQNPLARYTGTPKAVYVVTCFHDGMPLAETEFALEEQGAAVDHWNHWIATNPGSDVRLHLRQTVHPRPAEPPAKPSLDTLYAVLDQQLAWDERMARNPGWLGPIDGEERQAFIDGVVAALCDDGACDAAELAGWVDTALTGRQLWQAHTVWGAPLRDSLRLMGTDLDAQDAITAQPASWADG